MRNFFYSFILLFTSTLSVSAQKLLPNYDIRPIPSLFTSGNTLAFYTEPSYGSNTYSIYDAELNQIKTINSEIISLDLDLYVGSNGVGDRPEYHKIYFTQTLFNDDVEWEYIVEGDDSYTVMNTKGKVVCKIPTKWSRNLLIIDDVVYTYNWPSNSGGDNGKEVYYFYTFPEFIKLFSGGATGVKSVHAANEAASNATYDLAGRRVADNHKGFVIKNAKKMIVK